MSCMAHHYNLDGRCPVMDGFDLLATTPTGSGKVGYLILLMLVVREIPADMTHAIAKEILPGDPGMIVVCPTKALEDEIVSIIIYKRQNTTNLTVRLNNLANPV